MVDCDTNFGIVKGIIKVVHTPCCRAILIQLLKMPHGSVAQF